MKNTKKVVVAPTLKDRLLAQQKAFQSNYDTLEETYTKSTLESALGITIISSEIMGLEGKTYLQGKINGTPIRVFVNTRPNGRVNFLTTRFVVKENKDNHKLIVCELS